MAFCAGAGATNVDLLYKGFPRLPKLGEELYCDEFSLQLGGGLPATLINLGSAFRRGLQRSWARICFRNLQNRNSAKTV